MSEVRAPRFRPERLIAAARVVLAVFSLLAVWLDATEPAKFASLAYGLLIGYVLYAGLAAALVFRVETISRRWPLATHVTDLVFFSLFLVFTEGPGSPFNVYFVFALMCATLRWQARGTVATAVAILAVFIAFGVVFGVMSVDAGFDVRAFIIRGVYLFVFAVLLGYIGLHEQRMLHEMWLLTSWPPIAAGDADTIVQPLLGYAEPLMEAPVAILAWTHNDGRWMRLAARRGKEWSVTRQPATASLVHPDLDDRAFICADLSSPKTLTPSRAQGASALPWHGAPLTPDFAQFASAKTVLSVPLSGESVSGRLFLFDKADIALDDIVLAEIMASVIAGRLDTFYLHQELQQAAATEERIRLSRDLHDGVLQSFTGIALRLAAIHTMVVNDRAGVVTELEQLKRTLADEQRELRFFIQDLKPSATVPQHVGLKERLEGLTARVEREWDITVELRVEAMPGLEDPFCKEIYHLVREALVNAARHGLASKATVRVSSNPDAGVSVSVVDDGRGFAFAGRSSAGNLRREGLGPRNLRERVESLNGALMLDTSAAGAALHIVLPREAA